MSSPALETYLALLYTDAGVRQAFLADPERAARAAGLDPVTAAGLARIDRAGLVMAASSLAAKHGRRRRRRSWFALFLKPLFG